MLIIQILVIQGLVFVGLAVMLRWLFTRNVSSAMQRMDFLHRENLKREADLKKRLDAAEADYRAKIQEAHAQAQGILQSATQKADETREATLLEARRESERIIQEAHERREEVKRELEQEVELKAVGLASDAVRYVMTTKVEEGIHTQLVDELLEEVNKLDAGQLQIKAGPVEVLASQPLKPEQRRRLQALLAEKTKRPGVEVKESVDGKIIAGVIIRLDNLILDGSLRNKLKEAVSYVRRSRP